MAKILSTERAEFINQSLKIYQDNKVGQYSKYLEKNPFFVTYYSISTVHSRVDVGTGGVEHEIGLRSPIRFNKITDFPIYNVPEFKPDVTYDESGYDVDLDFNGLVILPNTIKPLPGDYLLIRIPDGKEFLMRVNQIRYNTIQSNDFYEIDADLKDIGDNIERFRNIDSQIVGEYHTIFEKIGTDDRCFLQTTDADNMNDIGQVFLKLRKLYLDAFYNRATNSFNFKTGYTNEGFESVLYDPYLSKFINESKIYCDENSEYTLHLHPNDILQDRFEYNYSRTLYRALIDRDLTFLSPNIISVINPVTKRFSPFIMNRMYADSVSLFVAQNKILGEVSEKRTGTKPVWFSLEKLPCCGPVWTPGDESQYFRADFIRQLLNCEINTDNIMELIIFNYLHQISSPISTSELLKSIDIDSIQSFYYIPMVCYILSEYYDAFFKSKSTLQENS